MKNEPENSGRDDYHEPRQEIKKIMFAVTVNLLETNQLKKKIKTVPKSEVGRRGEGAKVRTFRILTMFSSPNLNCTLSSC